MESDNQSKGKRPSFHIAPDAGPDDTIALISTLNDNPERKFSSLKELCALADETYRAGGRPKDSVTVAHMLELIKTEPVQLTAEGQRIANARAERRTELIHYLLYTGWDEAQPARNAPLWTYRTVCDLLWERGQNKVEPAQLTSELTANLYENEVFNRIANFDTAKISFSGKTIRGVVVWLEQLQPPAVQGEKGKKVFSRRSICSRELLLLALGWVYRDATGSVDGNSYLNSPDLPLTRERRDKLCKLCLLEPAALDTMLKTVISTYPSYVVEGTTAGALNRFLRLYRMPQLTDEALLV